MTWRFDRLGRSLRHLLEVVEDLDERNVGLRTLTESIDTTTSTGRLVCSIFGALAAVTTPGFWSTVAQPTSP